MKVGDVVTIIKGSGGFYKEGARAALDHQDEEGDWWGNFRGQENPEGSFKDRHDAVWCIGREAKIPLTSPARAIGAAP